MRSPLNPETSIQVLSLRRWVICSPSAKATFFMCCAIGSCATGVMEAENEAVPSGDPKRLPCHFGSAGCCCCQPGGSQLPAVLLSVGEGCRAGDAPSGTRDSCSDSRDSDSGGAFDFSRA